MDQPGFERVLEGLTNSPSRTVSALALYSEVPAIYGAMLEAIRGAERSVTFETYLFWPGEVAEAFAEAFCERARAGVSVKLLFDADGSRKLTWRFIRRLEAAGCEVRLFRPFLWYQPIQYNHRTHRKVMVVDGRIGFTGGVGVADMWVGPPPWLELMTRLEGEAVGLLQGAFFQNWVIAGGSLCLGPAFFPPLEAHGEARVMVTTSSPIWGDSSMRLLYYSAIASAHHRILLASPYFLPNWDTAAALGAAAARGVEVRLLLPGPINDKMIAYYTSRRLYGPLLAAGVRIFEYQPAMMHAKGMVVDDRWVTLGSTNFDPRSFFLNSELNTSIDDPAFARTMAAFFQAAFARSEEISFEGWKRRGLWEHALGWAGLVLKDQL
jgi:cardiolipin synthase